MEQSVKAAVFAWIMQSGIRTTEEQMYSLVDFICESLKNYEASLLTRVLEAIEKKALTAESLQHAVFDELKLEVKGERHKFFHEDQTLN